MKQSDDRKIYLYGRLSDPDENEGDSDSIQNQRLMLTKFAEDNGFKGYEFIFDDGVTGTKFEKRPVFAKMIEEAEAGLVSVIIVKDLSRFGRGYLKVGLLMDFFEEKNIRFIAIGDNVDTAQGENDYAPMVNFFNEWYVKNTSQKIRAVKHAKGKAGERLAVIPIYGYRKAEDGSTGLAVDEESAEVVRRIFKICTEHCCQPKQITYA